MTLLLTLLISLLPLSAFAGDLRSIHPHSYNEPSEGVLVIPNGQGGVTYWRGQGGTDAYTAAIIGQGITRQFQQTQTPAPRYTPPPLEAPDYQSIRRSDPTSDANATFLDYLNSK